AGPITLSLGLFAFLIAILFLTHQEIQIDVEGVPLTPMNKNMQPMSAEMRELLYLSGQTGWKKDPETKARVMELSNSIEGKTDIHNSLEKPVQAAPLSHE
ncbi:MAG TPA: hypothetical protein DDZ90_24945, partial [Planctomycetaceae bacterium]|nr:hypothetical protein [Planctomycetaceae bacterium]